ncbi:hypothetical protein [Paenibacillus sp. RC67]|uniref:hypothetical protein n=1 Tax=Paenibacillus sp. RC67 TaxID=3039392 RepID=UPI0024AE1DDC|nr:hypothetical protein [Paenibacillus sp. RC67]
MVILTTSEKVAHLFKDIDGRFVLHKVWIRFENQIISLGGGERRVLSSAEN